MYAAAPESRWRDKFQESNIRSVASILQKISKYSEEDGLALYRTHLRSRSLNDVDITSFQLITLYLPPEELVDIIGALDARQFASKAIEGLTLTNFNWAIDHIERAPNGPEFLSSVFQVISEEHYSEYRRLFISATGYRPIELHMIHLNKYCPLIRMAIAQDATIREHITQLGYARNKVRGGVRSITRRYVKNFVGIKSYESFVDNFTHNFSGDFRVDLESPGLILKLVQTIYRFSYNSPNRDLAERGRDVTRQIIRSLTDAEMRVACSDLKFLEELERRDGELFRYVSARGKTIF